MAVNVGTVIRFDGMRGYGFVAPDSGGEDVFVHANAIEGDPASLSPGDRVEFVAVEGERGRKAVTVRLLERLAADTRSVTTLRHTGAGHDLDLTDGTSVDPAEAGQDDGLCDVLSTRTFTSMITEALLADAGDLSATQILRVRQTFLLIAQRHGWVED